MLYPKTDTNAKANHSQLIMVPRAGKKFIFKRTPGASYASVGVVYTCSGYPSDGYGDIHITRADKSSGTYDRLSAWEWAEWEYVDEKSNT